jgi:hypothetical protein
VLRGHVDVGQGLRLHALRGIHHQQRALARGQGTRHLIVEIHVSRRIDEIQLVGQAILRLVRQAHRSRLDGDSALALQFHVVEKLVLLFTLGKRASKLDQAVSQRRFSMIDVGDDREIANQMSRGRHFVTPSAGLASALVGLFAYHIERELPWKMRFLSLQHQVDSLANVFRDRHLCLVVQEFELLVLFRGDVHGGRNLVPRHGRTLHDHMSIVK